MFETRFNTLSPRLRYGYGGLDRAADRRKDAAWIQNLLDSNTTRFLPNWRYRHAVRDLPEGPQAVAVSRSDAAPLIEIADLTIFLGLDDGSAVFALDLSAEGETALADRVDGRFEDLRKVGPLLSSREASMLAYSRGMIYWHRHHRFCSRCGQPAESQQVGHVRRCTDSGCGKESFPRTDPAVIMLVEHRPENGRPLCLLGRGSKWPPGSFSTLAGFVEPGESLEEAVAREIWEEAGLVVDQATYRGSQPWPFPSSLMLGFRAQAQTLELRLDSQELADAGWFTVDELQAFGEWGDPDAELRLPRKDSIARQLVDEWVAEQRALSQ